MNVSTYKQAFLDSHHSPGVRNLRLLLGGEKSITDFCVPVNIGFPPPDFLDRLRNDLLERLKYYPSEPHPLREKFAAFLGLPPDSVIAGNGSTELFYNFLSALGPGRRLLTCVPTFGRWTDAPRAGGHFVVGYPRRAENGFALDPCELVTMAAANRIDTIILSNPNNPTGHLTGKRELLELIRQLQSGVPTLEHIIVDESFLDFSPLREEASLLREARYLRGVIVLKSLGKSFGLHGTRMGVLVASPETVKMIEPFVPYWNVNGVAESVIDLMPAFASQFQLSLEETIRATREMRRELSRLEGVTVYDTNANFVYLKLPDETDPVDLRDRLLLDHGLFVRSCGNKEASDALHFRIATRPLDEVRRLAAAIRGGSGLARGEPDRLPSEERVERRIP
jgi:histidinol-phosphate/aromatic aminotransferase/cobyric acid decarboxylase-like protein